MFDLNNAIAAWKRPFLIRQWYTADDVSELESHLTDSFDVFVQEGMPEEESFQVAVSQVGDELVLRARFKDGWLARSLLVKYWLLLSAESAAFPVKPQRIGYRIARTYSFWVGLGSLVYLNTFFHLWYNGHPPWQHGVSLEGQGMMFLLLWGLTSVFNLTTYGRWQRRWTDWLRLVYGSLAIFLLIVLLVAGNGIANIKEWLGLTVFTISFVTGPALWLSQAFYRREDFTSGKISFNDLTVL